MVLPIPTGQPAFDIRTFGSGQPVDLAAVREFMAATLEQMQDADLDLVETELEEKGRRMRALLRPEVLEDLSEEQLRRLLRSAFATRRRTDQILALAGITGIRTAIHGLLYGAGTVDLRFQQFVDALSDQTGVGRAAHLEPAHGSAAPAALTEGVFCDVGSELLHYVDPQQYWLWTRWLWDPRVGTGALPLVTLDECNLHGGTIGETYVNVGIATAFVRATGEAAGFTSLGRGPHAINVFLACVYAVYMYTTLRIRMTQEFTKIVPHLPELIRRLLGVWKMEI